MVGRTSEIRRPIQKLRPARVAQLLDLNVATINRWCSRGVKVNGEPIYLARVRVGGHWRIPADALEVFLDACNGGRSSAPRSAPLADPAASPGYLASMARLRAMGVA